MVSLGLSLNNVGYNANKTAIIGTANITTSGWGADPGFDYSLLLECREGGENGASVGGIDSKSGHVGPNGLTASLDFHFFVDESKAHVVIGTFLNVHSNQIIRRVVKTVSPVYFEPGKGTGISRNVIIAGLILVGAYFVLGKKSKRIKW